MIILGHFLLLVVTIGMTSILSICSYDDKLKDINSPDSNDSGIQADVRHTQAPESENLYAVVDKSKKQPKPAKTPPNKVSWTKLHRRPPNRVATILDPPQHSIRNHIRFRNTV